MVQWSFKAPYCQDGTPQEPPFPEPFLSACSHPWTGPGTMSDHVGANIEILLFFGPGLFSAIAVHGTGSLAGQRSLSGCSSSTERTKERWVGWDLLLLAEVTC